MPDIDPARTALLVVDYQVGLLPRVADSDALVARVRRAIEAVRETTGVVAFVRTGFTDEDVARMPETAAMRAAVRGRPDAVRADAPATRVDERLGPAAGDIVVRKRRVGAFSTTDLDPQLRERGVDTLVHAGIATSGCVLSTVRDAADRDYRQLLLTDACADPDPAVHEFLVARIFPRHAELLTVDELEDALGA